MRTSMVAVISSVIFAAVIRSEGRFVFPSGPDGLNIFYLRQKINITWTGMSEYPVFSLCVLQSTNRTQSWLISNSESHPTTYEWTVDVDQLGFDLNDSREFSFYACNGSEATGNAFSLPFYTSNFIVSDQKSYTPSSFSSSSSSVQSTPTGAANQNTSTSDQASTSDANDGVSHAPRGLSTSAGAGIGIAVVLGVIPLASAIGCFILKKRKRSMRTGGVSETRHQEREYGGHHGPAQLHADSLQKPPAELDSRMASWPR